MKRARAIGYLVLTAALWASGCRPGLESDREYCAEMTPPPGFDDQSHPGAARYQVLIDGAVARAVPGIAMAIQDRDGLWIGSAGQCDVDRNVPMRPFSRSRIASVTKPFIATTTLLLAEEGRLGLDDVIADHLDPQVASRVANSEKITIRQLLNHTSGLPDEPMTVSAALALDLMVDDPYQDVSRDEYVAAVYDKPALFAPGEDWAYSNFGYALVGLILENATGQDEWEVVRSRVLEPLALKDTFYDARLRTPRGLARGYADLYGNGSLTDTSDWDALHPLNAEGGIVSTAYDLVRFMDAIINGDLLKPSSRTEMLTCVEAEPDEDLDAYGLGIGCTPVDGKPTYNHQGLVMGYIAAIYAYPEQGAIVAMIANGSHGSPQEALADLLDEGIPRALE